MLFSFWAQTLLTGSVASASGFLWYARIVLVCLYYIHNVVLGSRMTGNSLRGKPALFHS